jgi:hypothetical protein
MGDETERLYAKIVAQEREIVNLRGGYALIRGQLHAALESLKGRQTSAAAAMRRAAIAAEKAAAEIENAASVASELVSRSEREAKSLSPAAAAAAAAVKLLVASARDKLAEVVKAEKETAQGVEASLAVLEAQHDATGALLNNAIELAATIALDSRNLKDALDKYMKPSNN